MLESVTITTSCLRCGDMVTVEVLKFIAEKFAEMGQQYPILCPACEKIREREREQEETAAIQNERAQNIDAELDEAGVPESYRVATPPCPDVASFLKRHIGQNVLFSSPSGTGKSTSAGYLTRLMLHDGKRVRYTTLADLLDQWREARCGDSPMSVKTFLSYIEWNDMLIIDEAADKTVSTDSAKECMFRLLEDVSNGNCRARLWMLGNYYRGAIEDVFGNGEAARRRLNEKFYCAMMKENQIKQIRL